MRVLVACEFSGVVREAFRKRGHLAYSCDLLAAEDGSRYHLQDDVRDVLRTPPYHFWDLIIAHPTCTRLCNSGVRWLYVGGRGTVRDPQKWREMEQGAAFFEYFWRGAFRAHALRIAIENPIMHDHAAQLINAGPPAQIIQPWMFGHKEMKATCLWLRNLPRLVPTNIVGPPPKDPIARRKWAKVHQASPGPNRWKERSRTLPGIADAMADQWGSLAS